MKICDITEAIVNSIEKIFLTNGNTKDILMVFVQKKHM